MTSTTPRGAVAAFATAAALAGAALGIGAYALADRDAPTVVRNVTVAGTAQRVAAGTSTIADLVERVSPSVVTITVGGETATPFGGGGGGGSQGSGFVLDADGHVVTNQHVVGGATRATVGFADGTEARAEVVGTDPSTDLAVLKVDPADAELVPLELADSDRVRVGDEVVAIGSPFGLDQTVTAGIVSAVGREIGSPNGFAIDDAIQTDAPINSGNSGGPLLDLGGRVIGVNSQIESRTGGNVGIGFAVPSATVKKIAATLISDGAVRHAYLGVSLDDGDAGATIGEVRSGTPAEDAGLRVGDRITAADGAAVEGADDLRAVIATKQPGDELELTIERGGDTRTVTVTLGDRPTS